MCGFQKAMSSKMATDILHVSLAISLVFMSQSLAEKSVSASTQSSHCSYTVIVNEFDVSKCQNGGDHAQSDGVEFHSKQHNAEPQLRNAHGKYDMFNNVVQNTMGDSSSQDTNGKLPEHRAASNVRHLYETRSGSSTSKTDQVASLNSLIKDMEAKLLDEMVRSRELNSTLARHELLLASAQEALESYKTNFSSVFRTMMLMERKLQNQRKINKSLDKKLSNVILDVVEVNNVLTQKLPIGDAAKSSKKFAVESISDARSCPGISDSSTLYKGTFSNSLSSLKL